MTSLLPFFLSLLPSQMKKRRAAAPNPTAAAKPKAAAATNAGKDAEASATAERRAKHKQHKVPKLAAAAPTLPEDSDEDANDDGIAALQPGTQASQPFERVGSLRCSCCLLSEEGIPAWLFSYLSTQSPTWPHHLIEPGSSRCSGCLLSDEAGIPAWFHSYLSAQTLNPPAWFHSYLSIQTLNQEPKQASRSS